MMSIKFGIAAAVTALCLASTANAASCTLRTVTFSLEGSSSAHCSYGTDVGKNGIVAQDKEMFGMSGWMLGQTTSKQAAIAQQARVGYGAVTFSAAPAFKKSAGTWALNEYSGYGPLMIVLKAGRKMSAFLLDDMESLAGLWKTGREVCNAKGCKTLPFKLKHASVYYNPLPAPSEVPVPAAGFLLLGGLAGLAALRRMRKSA